MKKVLFIASISFFIFSCTKKNTSAVGNYTCDCIVNDGTATDTSHLPENNVTLSAAQSYCNQQQTIFIAGNPGSSVTCSIK